MSDRREVRPEHLLRAVLDDVAVREVLAELGVAATDVLTTLEHKRLAATRAFDVESLHELGIDVATVMTVLNPPYDAEADWQGRVLSRGAQEVCVAALAESVHSDRGVTSGHLLLGLLRSRDRLVAGTLREHGLRLRPARVVVAHRGRRS
ncbi:Clp protease N-terminal domain-containing protein [Nocardioides taihuensis]|uniref:Clp protease N-terminal domain-containing protein n=1 Tax=Nocardioides taihuensis TaxID=1835606 RepID=A0ABW0BFB4_9ACTN